MCVPAAAAAVAIAAASTAVGVIQSNKIASAQNKALQQQNELRKKEIDQATTAEINERLREMRREQSRIMVAAGEAGLSLTSPSIDGLLMDSAMQAELASDRSLANRESRKKASDAATQSQMQAKYTPLGAALKIGLSAGGTYANAKATQNAAIDKGE